MSAVQWWEVFMVMVVIPAMCFLVGLKINGDK